MKRAQAPAHVLLLAACAWLPAACGLNQEGVPPPSDAIAYPASAVMDGSGNWLFVTNSNADLRYNDGTLITLSLNRAADDRDPNGASFSTWKECPSVSYPNPRSDDPHFCCWDALNHERDTLNCDERYYIGPDDRPGSGDGNVRIGSFAAGMVLQHRRCPTLPAPCSSVCTETAETMRQDDRLLLGVRGDTSLTFIDVEASAQPKTTPPRLKCSSEARGFPACDDSHRVNQTGSALAGPSDDPDPPPVTLPDEPYALAVDELRGLLFIGHLTGNTARPFTGGFTLFDVTPKGEAPLDTPRLIAPFQSPFSPNSVGSVGVTALSFLDDNVYAASRYAPQVARLGTTIACPQPGNTVREIAAFPDGTFYNSPLTGAETRGIAFFQGTDRAFVLQRTPPALIGFLGTQPTDVLETCGSPTFLDKYSPDATDPDGPDARLFVTCFADGEIYVFDPAVPRLVKSFIVGRGPAGLVFDRDKQVAYSVNFGDNDIAVIDLNPKNTTQYRVVQRIGFPRTAPR